MTTSPAPATPSSIGGPIQNELEQGHLPGQLVLAVSVEDIDGPRHLAGPTGL